MPPSASTPPEYSALRQFGIRGPAQSYARFLVRYTRSRLTAHVIVMPQGRMRMAVRTDADALEVNFARTQVTHPDQAETYRPRPGFYLHHRLAELRTEDTAAILLNGNNIGYWGNQYVIQNRKIRYKRRGALFDDGRLPVHATGDHVFFLADKDTFRIENLALIGTAQEGRETLENVTASTWLPRYGLSGFPVVRRGRPVWKEHGALAWDPGLLFDLGRIRDLDSIELRDHVLELLAAGAALARHPMTVVGIDVFGNVVLLIVERSAHSQGMTVAEAADLLRRRFQVRDAIVLGAAGDAQLATTEEGFLTEPLVAPHARHTALPIPDGLLSTGLRGRQILARPVPCYVELTLTDTHGRSVLRPSAEPAGMA